MTEPGGTLLFESTNLVTVVDGLHSTIIGENTVSGTLTDALANPAVWLELEVDGTILSPRERILSVGYALMADGVKPDSITTAMIVNEAVTAGKVDAASFNQTFWQAGGNTGTTPGTHYLGTAKANHEGAFVWGDSTYSDVASGDDQVASGIVSLVRGKPLTNTNQRG